MYILLKPATAWRFGIGHEIPAAEVTHLGPIRVHTLRQYPNSRCAGPKTLLALAERLLYLFQFGHIRIRSEPLHHSAFKILERLYAGKELSKSPIGSFNRKYHFERFASRNRSGPLLQYVGQNLRIVNALPTPAFHLLRSSSLCIHTSAGCTSR